VIVSPLTIPLTVTTKRATGDPHPPDYLGYTSPLHSP
jgi:hypothetical protein